MENLSLRFNQARISQSFIIYKEISPRAYRGFHYFWLHADWYVGYFFMASYLDPKYCARSRCTTTKKPGNDVHGNGRLNRRLFIGLAGEPCRRSKINADLLFSMCLVFFSLI